MSSCFDHSRYDDANYDGCDVFHELVNVFEWSHAIALTARLEPWA